MTVPDPARPGRSPSDGLDPMPGSPPAPVGPGDLPGRDPDLDPPRPDPAHDGRLVLVAAGREDRQRHVVDVDAGEVGDPTGLRARCGAPVERIVPGLRADQADCPGCRLPVRR